MGTGRNPAVLAGLGGSLALALPAPAVALSLDELAGTALSSPGSAFAAGVATGAVAVGGIVGAVALARGLSRRAARRREASAAAAGEAGAPVEETSDALPTYRPRHLRLPEDAVAPAPAREADVLEPAPVPVPKPLFAADDARPGRRGPSHAARDYEDVAQNYVGRLTFRERMARRAAGVAETLRERLDAGRMAGVPVIERADGTVGDVGTSWWTASVGADAIPRVLPIAPDDPLAIPADFTDVGRRLDAGLSADLLAPRAEDAARRGISRRVAPIDQCAYPERRSVEELTEDDDWAAALRSLDELASAELGGGEPAADVPIEFLDSVGGADTLDEPDGLEPDTAFIPFRPPAGHPEVVDTETYVDYLIKDEFSKNSSRAVRRSSRRFLRVLEGGTQRSAHLAGSPSPERPAHAPRHFASTDAAEA